MKSRDLKISINKKQAAASAKNLRPRFDINTRECHTNPSLVEPSIDEIFCNTRELYTKLKTLARQTPMANDNGTAIYSTCVPIGYRY